mmetsp:Transcript_21289/g.52047  ORF Transcript_21289/g.52047 Transcript_21289/m.52047 type:complete len:223 (+) Transcript_21289:2794-3462(+)
MVADDELHADGLGACLHDLDDLGMGAVADKEDVLGRLGARRPEDHRHGLGTRRRLVQQRRVGDLHAGQFHNHCLVVEQRLEPPLADLCLVRGVGGVPGGIGDEAALDDGRQDVVVVAHADEGLVDDVLPGDLVEQGAHDRLALRRLVQVELILPPNARRHRLLYQLLNRRHAQHLEHVSHLGAVRADVSTQKGVRGAQKGWHRHITAAAATTAGAGAGGRGC